MPPGHIGPPGNRGDWTLVARVMGSIKATCAEVAKPKCDARTECVSKKTSPGPPNTVMVERCVRREVL